MLQEVNCELNDQVFIYLFFGCTLCSTTEAVQSKHEASCRGNDMPPVPRTKKNPVVVNLFYILRSNEWRDPGARGSFERNCCVSLDSTLFSSFRVFFPFVFRNSGFFLDTRPPLSDNTRVVVKYINIFPLPSERSSVFTGMVHTEYHKNLKLPTRSLLIVYWTYLRIYASHP